MKKTLFLLVAVLFYGCSSTFFPNRTSPLDVWLTHTSNELIQQWGPADAIADDGAGGQVLIYTRSVNLGDVNTTVKTKNSYTNVYIPQLTVSKDRMFYVDVNGIIYRTMWRVR